MFKQFKYFVVTYLNRLFIRKYWISNKRGYNYILNDYIPYKSPLDKLFIKYESDKGGFETVHKAKFEVMRPKNLNMNSEMKIEGRKIYPKSELDRISHNPP